MRRMQESYTNPVERFEHIVAGTEKHMDLVNKNFNTWKEQGNNYMVHSCKNKLIEAKKELKCQKRDAERWALISKKSNKNDIYTI